ncbi:hypothetical protein LMG33810_000766 [Carnimonas sp. LMG 33810]
MRKFAGWARAMPVCHDVRSADRWRLLTYIDGDIALGGTRFLAALLLAIPSLLALIICASYYELFTVSEKDYGKIKNRLDEA